MIKIDVKVDDLMTGQIKKIQKELAQVPREGYREFLRLTPIKTGNARRSTRFINGDTIEADYPYAEVLDKGRHMTNRGMRGSIQAPKGMTLPWTQWWYKRIRKILGV